MITLQEYLNQKFPTKLEKERVSTLFFTKLSEKMKEVIMFNELVGNLTACLDETEWKQIEGGELNLNEYINLGEVRIDGDYLKTSLTKISISGCPNLGVLICVNNDLTSAEFLKQLPSPKKLRILSIYNNKIQSTNIEVFSRFVNLMALKIGTQQKALKDGKHNKFYGSLKSYQNLTKLTSICIEATDINEGLEYLPESLADSTFERSGEDVDEGGYQKIERRPHDANSMCSAIQNELRPFNYDLEAWQLCHPEKMFRVKPQLFSGLGAKGERTRKLEQKIIATKQEIQETEISFPEKLKRRERLRTKLQSLIQTKANLKVDDEEPIEMDFLIIADKSGVKEELIKENIWNIRLEGWSDKKRKEKVNFWMVEKGEFSEKDLFKNKILASAISGEKKRMVLLKIQEGDEKTKSIVSQLQGINITAALLVDENFVKQYQGGEAWLLERDKVAGYFV